MSRTTPTPRLRRSLLPRALLCGVVLGATACSVLGGGGPAYDLAGPWEGSVTVEGQQLDGALDVEQEGEVLTVVFTSPSTGIEADGTGALAPDGSVTIELAYDMGCPGTARMQGQVAEDGDRMSGRLTATDCNGTMSGTFSLRRAR